MTGEETSLALAGTMIRIEQIKHDFGSRHFGFVYQRQFHLLALFSTILIFDFLISSGVRP
jgi:hypothetical protein